MEQHDDITHHQNTRGGSARLYNALHHLSRAPYTWRTYFWPQDHWRSWVCLKNKHLASFETQKVVKPSLPPLSSSCFSVGNWTWTTWTNTEAPLCKAPGRQLLQWSCSAANRSDCGCDCDKGIPEKESITLRERLLSKEWSGFFKANFRVKISFDLSKLCFLTPGKSMVAGNNISNCSLCKNWTKFEK